MGFHPPRLLRNPHVQSVLSSLAVRRPLVLTRARSALASSRSLILECGDGVRLQGFYSACGETATASGNSALAVLIHGWEGSANSLYVLSAAAYLHARGFEVFRLNLRDHGDTHHLNEDIFHSCRIAEVVGAIRALQLEFPDRDLVLAGYSLGGNFAVRVALRAPDAGVHLRQVVAVCPVVFPRHTMRALEEGWFGYRRYFLHKWRRSLERKQACHPRLYDFSGALRLPSLTALTDYLVRQHTEFPDSGSYFDGYALTGMALERLQVPTEVIATEDDPIIPSSDYAGLARPQCLRFRLIPRGGHCGFMAAYDLRSWADEEVYGAFSRALSA